MFFCFDEGLISIWLKSCKLVIEATKVTINKNIFVLKWKSDYKLDDCKTIECAYIPMK